MQRFGAGELPFLPIRLPQTLQPEGFAECEEEGGQGEAGEGGGEDRPAYRTSDEKRLDL